jgi:hypothetical protein
MFTLDDIYVYILNWKKVSDNSLKIFNNVSPIIKNTIFINCDEHLRLTRDIPHIQLNDSHYYGSQFNTAIKNVKEGAILCVIVGDNIADNDYEKIFNNALSAFNEYNAGVFGPNDKRSPHQKHFGPITMNLYSVPNTDCGFWFIHPNIVKRLRGIDYTISKYGWGCDTIVMLESKKQRLLILRDFSTETDQLDHTTNYDIYTAQLAQRQLEMAYNALP